ncbi:MAG: helix-turn-helix transcriptional regulator [Rhodobacteraceae bacterium]|nr:helix-turn-helix transcriptional regulator [Paracoccaceae bacterium]
MTSLANKVIDTVETFQRAEENGDVWSSAVELSRDLGFKHISIADFGANQYLPHWWRTSLVETHGHEEYIEKGYIDIDPALHARRGKWYGDISYTNIHQYPLIPRKEQKSVEHANWLESARLTDYYMQYCAGRSSGQESFLLLITDLSDSQIKWDRHGPDLPILGGLLTAFVSPPQQDDKSGHVEFLYDLLTVREQDALRFLASGLSNDEIAYRMGIAEVTVRLHIKKARDKMGAKTREQAIALAMKRGLLRI